MNNYLIINIKKLCGIDRTGSVRVKKGKDMDVLDTLEDAFLEIVSGKIKSFGRMSEMTLSVSENTDYEVINASDKFVLPTWCDSHTHLVFSNYREIEYQDKIRGLSYEDIAKRGGGILNSVERLRASSEDDLFHDAFARMESMKLNGTGAVEIKTGYGLDVESELKMLRVIQRLKNKSDMTVKSTFLGAHAVPKEYKNNRSGYVKLIVDEMIPNIAKEHLADYVDVFCDRGFFTVDDTAAILEAGLKYGMKPKIHANELDYSGGIQVGVKYGAVSVDHLEYTGDAEIEVLKNSNTIPTILPGAAFFLNMVYAPARKMIESGLPVAMASDYNPGSSPSGNMQLVISFASVLYRMTPNEAINAVTINSAAAMEVSDTLGSIAVGKKGNVIITKGIPSLEYIPYAYGENKIDRVIINK